MPASPEKIPAFEAIGPASALSGYESLSNNSNVSLNTPNSTMVRNTLKAMEMQDKKLAGSPALLGSFRPALEKIGALSHDINTAANLKDNFRKMAKQISQTNKVLLETNTALCEWSKSFSSSDVTRLSLEINDYMKVHYGLNALLEERFENISLRLKAIENKENRRDKLVIESAKAKKDLEDFKKKSTDSNTISTLADKYNYKTQNLVASQDLLEVAVRTELRPALVGYAYSLNIYAQYMNKLSSSTNIDLEEFDRKLKESDSMLGAQLNMATPEFLKFPRTDLTKKFAEALEKEGRNPSKSRNGSRESLNSFDGNQCNNNEISESDEEVEPETIGNFEYKRKDIPIAGGGEYDSNVTLKRNECNVFAKNDREAPYFVGNENDKRLRKKRIPNESNFNDSNDNVQEVMYPFKMPDNIWKTSK